MVGKPQMHGKLASALRLKKEKKSLGHRLRHAASHHCVAKIVFVTFASVEADFMFALLFLIARRRPFFGAEWGVFCDGTFLKADETY